MSAMGSLAVIYSFHHPGRKLEARGSIALPAARLIPAQVRDDDLGAGDA